MVTTWITSCMVTFTIPTETIAMITAGWKRSQAGLHEEPLSEYFARPSEVPDSGQGDWSVKNLCVGAASQLCGSSENSYCLA